jgi:hypothetical protein
MFDFRLHLLFEICNLEILSWVLVIIGINPTNKLSLVSANRHFLN